MMRSLRILTILFAGALALGLGSCQTNTPVAEPATPEPSVIATESGGFSPLAGQGRDIIDFAILIGSPEALLNWKVDFMTAGVIKKTIAGIGADAPSILTWDGKADSGKAAPQGSYVARLTTYYSGDYKISQADSSGFVLDTEPPAGALGFSPSRPGVGLTGFADPVTITIDAKSDIAAIESWTLELFDGRGKLMKSISDSWPGNTASWDGSSYEGGAPKPMATYRAVATVMDEYGNSGEITGTFQVAPLPVADAVPPARQTPPTAEASAIISLGRGFSPNGDGSMDMMEFELAFGQPKSIKSWKVELSLDGKIVRRLPATDTALPRAVAWDGRKDDGTAAAEGLYLAALSIDYGTSFKPVAVRSAPFILAVKPPTGEVLLSEALYSPLESSPTIKLSIAASAPLAKMESWSMRILDPAGNLFKSFDGAWPDASVLWDGMGNQGYLVESAEDYAVIVKIRDEFGTGGVLRTVLPVDILVEKTETGYRILSSRIFFKAYTADFSSVGAAYAEQNVRRLDQLSEKLKKFPDYTIRIVGHAVKVYWDDLAKGAVEQEQVLVPLSIARAEAIARAMIARGFDPARITTRGVGAADQLVPDSNLPERWRNRRVAFFLERP